MQHQVLEYYQICSNYDPGLLLIYFTARSNLIPYAFVWEKVRTMDVLETIVIYDIKVDRCEYMKLYEYQRSKSFIDFGINHSDKIFLNFFSSGQHPLILTYLFTQVSDTEPMVLWALFKKRMSEHAKKKLVTSVCSFSLTM